MSLTWQQFTTVQNPEEDTPIHLKTPTIFKDFFLKPSLLQALDHLDYHYPSPIQTLLIPKIASGKENIFARANNGSGKTAAYLIPILNEINKLSVNPQAIVLVPSRELGVQTFRMAQAIGKFGDYKIACLLGGMDTNYDIQCVATGPQLIIGTPGRMLDMMTKYLINVNEIRYVILDEIDKLCTQDFEPVVELLVEIMNFARIICISTTYPVSMEKHYKKIQSLGPHLFVNTMKQIFLPSIQQYYVYLKEDEKFMALNSLIGTLKYKQMLIFCNSNKRVEILTKNLTEAGVECIEVSSLVMQDERLSRMDKFNYGKARVMVCSDLVSRGCDFPNVEVAIHYDFPKYSDSYVHRIGRVGRLCAKGCSICFVKDSDKHLMFQFQQDLDVTIEPFSQYIYGSL